MNGNQTIREFPVFCTQRHDALSLDILVFVSILITVVATQMNAAKQLMNE